MTRIAAYANPLGVRWGRTVEYEQLVPPRRADKFVQGSGDGANSAGASKKGEDGAAPHSIAMSTRGRYMKMSQYGSQCGDE
jgi:hypothetical protein